MFARLLSRSLCVAIVATLQLGAARAQSTVPIDLPSGPLAESLRSLARQTKINILVDPRLVQGYQAPAIKGEQNPSQALSLLLVGTALKPMFVDERTVTIVQQVEHTNLDRVRISPMMLAEAPAGSDALPAAQQENKQTDRENRVELEEVVVTGTQIRGARNIPSPISIHSRDEIDRSGAGSIARFIQTLPENFQGGASAGTLGAVAGGGGTATNNVGAASVNLRGIGDDSTLILLNGRRLAPGNTLGNFVDVSMIPLAALDRVEVVPDGASALYGSDAVGGVVNFIMKKDFEGSETRVRYGEVTEGSMHELQLAQTLGTAWNTGSALLSYEYVDQAALPLNDKDWVRPRVRGVMDVIPEQERHGVFTSFNQSLGDAVALFADATYSHRVDDRRHSFGPSTGATSQQNYAANIDSYSATGGARVRVAADHEVELSVSRAASDTDWNVSNLLTGATLVNSDTDTSVLSVDAKLSGTLLSLPTGQAYYAVGAQYREETYRDFNLLTRRLRFGNQRSLWAMFTEVRLPLVGPDAQRGGDPRVELTLAGRFEEYSDFGSTANPKVGLSWQATPDLRLRGAWGTTFKAPLLTYLDPTLNQVAALLVFDPRANPPGNVPIAILGGGNPDLQPEEAKTWTVGFDWQPDWLTGLSAKATYYNIKYTDRVTNPQQALNALFNTTSDVLRFEQIAAPFIQRNPTVEQLQNYIANSRRFDDFTGLAGGVNLASVAALVDYRRVNLSSVTTSGIDFSLAYAWQALQLGIDSTYVLKLDNGIAPTVPIIEAVDTVYNPADLKLRARTVYTYKGVSAALFANYVDSYSDLRSGTRTSVSSWTTLDVNVSYQSQQAHGLWSGVAMSIGAINLTDKAPPHIASNSPSLFDFVAFDPANADPRGRFVYAQLSKRF